MLPTISVETKNGPVRINQADYKPDEHKLTDPQPEWSALFGTSLTPPPAPAAPDSSQVGAGAPLPPLAPAAPPAPPAPPSNVDPAAGVNTPPPPPPAPETTPPVPPEPVDMFVTKLEHGWFITDANGKPVDGKNGENNKGYSTKKEAETALKAK